MPSVLWRRWLGGRKGIRPVKTEFWGTGMVICLERGATDLHMVQLMWLPPPSSFVVPVKSRIFYLSGTGLPRLSWKLRPLNGCSSNSCCTLFCQMSHFIYMKIRDFGEYLYQKTVDTGSHLLKVVRRCTRGTSLFATLCINTGKLVVIDVCCKMC